MNKIRKYQAVLMRGLSEKLTFPHRRGNMNPMSIIGLAIGIVVLLLVIASTLPTSLGTLANRTSGSAMVNVPSGTKSLYSNIGLFAVIGIVVAVVGIAIYSFKGK